VESSDYAEVANIKYGIVSSTVTTLLST